MSQKTTSKPRPVQATITIMFDSNVSNDQLRSPPFYQKIMRGLKPNNVAVNSVTITRPTHG